MTSQNRGQDRGANHWRGKLLLDRVGPEARFPHPTPAFLRGSPHTAQSQFQRPSPDRRSSGRKNLLQSCLRSLPVAVQSAVLRPVISPRRSSRHPHQSQPPFPPIQPCLIADPTGSDRPPLPRARREDLPRRIGFQAISRSGVVPHPQRAAPAPVGSWDRRAGWKGDPAGSEPQIALVRPVFR